MELSFLAVCAIGGLVFLIVAAVLVRGMDQTGSGYRPARSLRIPNRTENARRAAAAAGDEIVARMRAAGDMQTPDEDTILPPNVTRLPPRRK